MKTQLLCTFTKRNRLYDTIGLIIECHDIVFNKIYVFANEDDHHQLICTYNIPQNQDNFIEGIDTIALHRKKQTNTLYTINSLNENGRLVIPCGWYGENPHACLLYTSPSPRDATLSRMPSSA